MREVKEMGLRWPTRKSLRLSGGSIVKVKRKEDGKENQLLCSFIFETPAYTPLSTAAATVNVPPITAQTPVRKPAKLFVFASRLMTFMGEIS